MNKTIKELKLIKDFNFKSHFRIEQRTFDNRTVFDVIANINNKHYQYNGYKDIEKAYNKFERYIEKASNIYNEYVKRFQ